MCPRARKKKRGNKSKNAGYLNRGGAASRSRAQKCVSVEDGGMGDYIR